MKGTYPVPNKAILCSTFLLVLAMSACSGGAPPDGGTLCGGGWPGLDKAKEEAEELVDFDVLFPTYLPATTSSIPEPTIHPRDEITILFPPCPEVASDILGPQVIIGETTVPGGLPEPGSSVPSTEQIQIAGTSALMQQGESFDAVTLAITWQQAGLSLSAHFQWGKTDASRPEITQQMKTEAIRVVESFIEQGQ